LYQQINMSNKEVSGEIENELEHEQQVSVLEKKIAKELHEIRIMKMAMDRIIQLEAEVASLKKQLESRKQPNKKSSVT
jgi:transposase